MKATLEYVEQLNHNVKTFWFKPDKSVKSVAGQFTELQLPHNNPDNRGIKRWFTIFSSPTEELFAITTKFAPKGSSFKLELADLQPGIELDFAEPMGDFILPKDKSLPLVFVSFGIGITPFRSIAKWLHDKGEKRDITLIQAVHAEEDILFVDLFDSIGAKVKIVVNEPGAFWSGHTGLVTAERISELTKVTDKTRVYLSGPEQVVEKITDDLKKTMPAHHVITDYFPGYDHV